MRATWEYILNLYQHTKGLIIDIRDNEGGDPANGFKIIRRIADQRRHVYTHRWKDGTGADDFTESEDIYLEPEGTVRYEGPVVLLTNRFCYSAANWFAAEMKAFPHVVQDWGSHRRWGRSALRCRVAQWVFCQLFVFTGDTS